MKNRKNFSGFAPIIILILIALGVVGYFGYKNYWPKTQPLATNSPVPSSTSVPTANWKTYTDSKNQFSFKYPPTLFTVSTDPTFIKFYLSESEAKDDVNCIQKQLGTLQNPCGQYMVLNIGVSKYLTNYQFRLKISPKTTESGPLKPIILNFIDSQKRSWVVEGPVGIAGAFNTKAEIEQDGSLYQVSVQIGSQGYERYSGNQLGDNEAGKLSDQILSTFKFTQ